MNRCPDPSRLEATSRLLADWFEADAPTREPAHLLAAVLDRSTRTQPRAAWLIPERWLGMTIALRPSTVPRTFVFIALIAAMVTAIGLIVLLAASSLNVAPPTVVARNGLCLLYTSPSPRDGLLSRMPSSA